MTQYIVYALGAALLVAILGAGIQTQRLGMCQKDLESKKVLIVQQQSAIAQRDATIEQVARQGKETEDRVRASLRKAEEARAKAQATVNEMVAAEVPTAPDEQIEYLYTVGAKLNLMWEEGK